MNSTFTTRFLSGIMILSVAGIFAWWDHARPAFGQSSIIIDQLGYRPGDRKLAFVTDRSFTTFALVSTRTNRTVYEGNILSPGKRDENTGDEMFTIDFSRFKVPGQYQILIPGTSAASDEFRIADDAYNPGVNSALLSFYYQRCGIEVNNGSAWRHPACHLTDAAFFNDPSLQKTVIGGWHDAGDYGKFVSTGAVSVAFLLYLYERQPESFTDGQVNIPEAGNGLPDILDEARWELSWLLTMQNDSGGVYHKVSTMKWTGEHLPQHDPDARYIFPVSTTATGAFAAVTAIASRIFDRWDKPFSHSLREASLSAWKFLERHQEIMPPGGFSNSPGVEGGEYKDCRDDDERLWASVELFKTTAGSEYRQYFLSHCRETGGFNVPVSWEHVENFAYFSFLNLPHSQSGFQQRVFLLGSLASYCENLLKRIDRSGYRCALSSQEYYWGSNSVALGYAFDLLRAYDITQRQRYLNAAIDQLHYVWGRNTYRIAFVTGIGSNSVRFPYHQFSIKLHAGAPVPGLLVGGPNFTSRLHGKQLSEYPGKCYEDSEKNYYVNEAAINYTAPFVFVAGVLADIQHLTTVKASLEKK